MTASEVQTELWASIPGFSSYEASNDGRVRSIDRTLTGGRRCKGQPISVRPSSRDYPQCDVRDDEGRKRTVEVHALMMLAFEGPCPPGKQVRHLNDVSADNRWPENLVYGTPKENAADRLRNHPPAPKPPPRLCVPHGAPVSQGSKTRCHECVVAIGVDGAELLRMGYSPEDAAAELEYASPDGLVKLAVKYGGYVELPPSRLSQRVRTTVRNWLRFGRGDRA